MNALLMVVCLFGQCDNYVLDSWTLEDSPTYCWDAVETYAPIMGIDGWREEDISIGFTCEALQVSHD